MSCFYWTVVLLFLVGISSAKVEAKPLSGSDAYAALQEKVVVAYVTSWSEVMPNPQYMTHINYAFGHVNKTFNGIIVDNENRLTAITSLKKTHPSLKVLLSIGGWGSGRFSEMAANEKNRRSFALSCQEVVHKFDLDGIDIDWEYPTRSAAGISSSPADTENYTLLMRDIRQAIGTQYLLTLASVASAEYIDFKAILPYIDFVNIMSYDMGGKGKHHAALYPSDNSGWMTASQAVEAHLKAGVPSSKLVMGMPFYGRGIKGYADFKDYRFIIQEKAYVQHWDSVAQVPYLADSLGRFIIGFDNPQSLAIKCQYIHQHKLLGGMYWDYAGDNEAGDLQRMVYQKLMNPSVISEKPACVWVITEGQGQHKAFSDAAVVWLRQLGKELDFELTVMPHPAMLGKDSLWMSDVNLIIQLDYPPYDWSDEAKQNFVRYMGEKTKAWIGFHHASLLGDFDGYPMWQWFSQFLGGIRFQHYIRELASGKVVVEDNTHPVMRGVSSSFVLPDDEWYIYDRSPRTRVRVLAHVDESSYFPASSVRMGDHPVIWTNERMASKNVYFQMGHSPSLFQSADFVEMFRNAVCWALGKIE